jgi:geranylgeranyl pyrophosphate synthase
VNLVATPTPDVTEYLAELRQETESALERLLPALGAPALLGESVRYALMGGGKRLRPCLTLATAECVGQRLDLNVNDARRLALPGACAVEMIHSYSLVHDDLPAMDDDSLRRGRPTAHVAYGDGLAILAGDGLLTEAFAVLAGSPSPAASPGAPEATSDQRLRAIATLASAAGVAGMVGGQAIDLEAAGQVTGHPPEPFNGSALADMHARKTGALIRAAVGVGAVLAGADDVLIGRVDDYARELGLAFQIVDDVLDVEESAEALGKTAGKDAASGKPTYPALYGVDASRRMAVECVDRAKAALAAAALRGRLSDIADWSLARRS